MKNTPTIQAGERTQHTPGPWRTQEGGRGFQINANGHEPGNSTVVATIHETAVFADEPEHAGADARLIAAAPELLEVALALVGAGPKYGADGVCKLSTREVVEMARAAIAKAEWNDSPGS